MARLKSYTYAQIAQALRKSAHKRAIGKNLSSSDQIACCIYTLDLAAELEARAEEAKRNLGLRDYQYIDLDNHPSSQPHNRMLSDLQQQICRIQLVKKGEKE